MLSKIKGALLKSPETIRDVLEHFNYANIKIHSNYISCGRDQMSSPKSIVIFIHDNDYLYVKDYPRNISTDLFSYIIQERGVTFRDVIQVVNSYLGISDYTTFFERKKAFGGFYDKVKKEIYATPPKLYDMSLLDEYVPLGNLRFLKDRISLRTQRFFDIRYDVANDGIVIPIVDQFGNLMGVKERVNHEIGPDEQKYWYKVPCSASKTLYGYAQNYRYLVENTILIFEAEKSVLQCYSYGIRNAVALGSGSISRMQTKMLYEIQPKKVIFLHDVGYEKRYISTNIAMYRKFGRFSETEIGYWDWTKSGYSEKYSPSDLGKNILEDIIKNQIVYV